MTIDIESELGDVRHWSVGEVLTRRASHCPDRLFLRNMPDGRTWTFGEMHAATTALAQGFLALGIAKGDHVGILSANCPEFVLACFALGKAGAVAVPVNTAARGTLLRYYLEHADCSTVIVDEGSAAALAAIATQLPLLRRVIVLGDVAAARAALEGVPVPVEDLPLRSAGESPLNHGARFSDLLYLMYTSGTTGPSKAIMITHASACHWGQRNVRYRYVEAGDVDYVFMPLFHANALLMSVTTALMAGTTVALDRRFSASRFWDQIRACGATRFNAVGAVSKFLYAQTPSAMDRDHRVRICALAPPPPFVQDFKKRYGVQVFSNFGLSDYASATTLSPDAPPDKAFSLGKPCDDVSVRVVDEDDFDVPVGQTGEIVLRSEQPWSTPMGYYKMPEATLAAQRNFWFHTGDCGHFDADGYLYFTDRKKDAIRRRGENISAYEVESVLSAHPDVQHVAVYAVRSEHTEDEVAASIVLNGGATPSPEAVIAYCIENMSAFMVPRYLEFIDALPLTPTNKVEKYRLRTRAEENPSRMWDREVDLIQRRTA